MAQLFGNARGGHGKASNLVHLFFCRAQFRPPGQATPWPKSRQIPEIVGRAPGPSWLDRFPRMAVFSKHILFINYTSAVSAPSVSFIQSLICRCDTPVISSSSFH